MIYLLGVLLPVKETGQQLKGKNDHTCLIDEAGGSESNNTPAKLNTYRHIKGEGNKKHPFTGVTLCMTCNTNNCDIMS